MKILNIFLISFLLFVINMKAQDTLPEFSIRSGELQRAALVAYPGEGCFSFEIILTKKKADELTAFTKNNLKKQVVISLNGKPVASPLIVEPIIGEIMEFPTGKGLKNPYELLLDVSGSNIKKAP
jgi:hypothetical protein